MRKSPATFSERTALALTLIGLAIGFVIGVGITVALRAI